MGILTDRGVLVNGKLDDGYWRKYVEDVKKMLATGEGIFPPGIVCTQKVKPNPNAAQLDIGNKNVYPEFTRIWYPRYENMVKSLDVNGDFQAAKNGLLPIIDPTAVAKVIGATPPDLDLPAALAFMIAGPPMGTPAFATLHFPSLAADPVALAGLLAPGSEFLSILIPSVPIPPIPSIPDPRLFEYGYTEQFNFELALGLAPLKTHLKSMVPALALSELPNIVGKLVGLDPGGLIEFMCKLVGGEHPKPMSTSSTEIAAQQVLIQHQVKFQALGFIGQQVGSGVVTDGIAKAPYISGGLDIAPAPEPEPVEITLNVTVTSAVRREAKRLIDAALRPRYDEDDMPMGSVSYPDAGFKLIAPSYSEAAIPGVTDDWHAAWDYFTKLQIRAQGNIQKIKAQQVDSKDTGDDAKKKVADIEAAAAADKGTSSTVDRAKEAAWLKKEMEKNSGGGFDGLGTKKSAISQLEALIEIGKQFDVAADAGNPFNEPGMSYADAADRPVSEQHSGQTAQEKGMAEAGKTAQAFIDIEKMTVGEAQAKVGQLIQKYPIFNTSRGYTTCGEMVRYVYSALADRTSGESPAINMYTKLRAGAPRYAGNMKSNGYIGWESDELNKTVPQLKSTKIYIRAGNLIGLETIGRGIEEFFRIPRSTVWRIVDPVCGGVPSDWMDEGVHPRLGDAMLVKKYANDHRRYDGYDLGGPEVFHGMPLPGIGPIMHVSIFYDRVFKNGTEYWVTADAGQGGRNKQGAAFKKLKVDRDRHLGILVSVAGSSGLFSPESSGKRKVTGWINIDLVPELLDRPNQEVLLTRFELLRNGNPDALAEVVKTKFSNS